MDNTATANEPYGRLIEPPDIPFTWGAPGWYVAGALLLLTLLVIAWCLYRYYIRNRYRSLALQEIVAIEARYQPAGDYSQLLYQVNMLLKRIAITIYLRSHTAAIRDQEWIAFLNSSSHQTLFNHTDIQLLQPLYSYHTDIPGEAAGAFVSKARQWIKKHSTSHAF